MKIEWWVFAAEIVQTLKIPMREAWNMTLREYLCLTMSKDRKAISSKYDEQSKEAILEHFELMKIKNG